MLLGFSSFSVCLFFFCLFFALFCLDELSCMTSTGGRPCSRMTQSRASQGRGCHIRNSRHRQPASLQLGGRHLNNSQAGPSQSPVSSVVRMRWTLCTAGTALPPECVQVCSKALFTGRQANVAYRTCKQQTPNL